VRGMLTAQPPKLETIMRRLPTRTGDATTLRRLAFLAVAMLLMIIFGSCSGPQAPAPAETVRELNWSRIPLPGSVAASSLTTEANELLVGGLATSGGDHPVFFVLDSTGIAHPVPLQPNSPYAKVADLMSLAVRGQEVVGLGVAHGGAHGNYRWTVWSGSTQRLVDYPQVFWTFGGEDAGGLLDIVEASDGPVIAGSWANPQGGLDAAVWLRRGQRWTRQNSAGTALANTQQLQVAPRAASAFGSAVIISGSVITFGDGVAQSAAVWTWPTRNSPWTLLRLPDAGRQSEALSTGCKETCWVSGHAEDKLALWSFDSVGAGGLARDSTLPSMVIDTDGPGPRTVMSGEQPAVIFSHAGDTTLLVHDSQDSWQAFSAPAGSVLDATTVGDRLYAIIKIDNAVGLWTTDLGTIRPR
jgi:hypothetical protein